MGSEGTVQEVKELVITQVGVGGFEEGISAESLSDFLERQFGLIWRCRLKTSWTPPESYPIFESTGSSKKDVRDDFERVKPHAFIHFATPEAAKRAYDASGRNDLVLNGCPLMVHLATESSFHVNRRRSSDPFKFRNAGIEIGTMVSQNEFVIGWKGPELGVDLLIDPFDGCFKILFTQDTVFSFKNTNNIAIIKCNFKMQFLVRDIAGLKLYTDGAPHVMLIQVMSSPWLYYRTADDDIYDSVPYNLLDDEDPWIRTTDFSRNCAIGRCSTFKISFSPRFGGQLSRANAFLKLQSVVEEQIRRPPKILSEPLEIGDFISDHFHCVPHKEGVSFDILFLLNALLHKGIINEFQVNEELFSLLKSHTLDLNKAALKHMWSYKRPIENLCSRLKYLLEWLLKNPRVIKNSQVKDHYVEVRRLIITPTTAYCLPPEVELSNRVLRHYSAVADRFLRVSFTDEGMQQVNTYVLQCFVSPIVKQITSNSFPQKTKIFRRINNILSEGFQLSGRRYLFLAFSSNQLRDRSVWSFVEDKNTSVDSITSWMGKFSDKNIAKCAARMGQCFSSSYATVDMLPEEVSYDLPDREK